MSINTCDHGSFLVVYEDRKCPVCIEEEEYKHEVKNLTEMLSQEEMQRENAEEEVEILEEELKRINDTYDFVMKMEDATNGRTVHNK
jgi:hypothetical protein